MPAKGANHSLPAECCARVKPRVAMLIRDCLTVNAKTRIRGMCWIRVFGHLARSRRAAALGGGVLAGHQTVVHPGPGWTNEDRRYQQRALAAGFSEMGSGAARTLEAVCEEHVSQMLTAAKQAVCMPCALMLVLMRFRLVLPPASTARSDTPGGYSAGCSRGRRPASTAPARALSSRARSPGSSRMLTPSALARSYFEPGSSPATT